jgi:hypothetical protein
VRVNDGVRVGVKVGVITTPPSPINSLTLLPDLIESVRKGNPKLERFDASVFTGEYVTGDIGKDYLDHLEQRRCDLNAAAQARDAEASMIDLHNSP